MSGELGSFLRRARLSRGLTQEELATKAALSVQAVGALERGDRLHPHRHTLDQLGAALDLSEAQRVALRGLAARRRSSVPGGGPVHQLPADVPAFVGRESSVTAAVSALTAAGGVPVVAVSGRGGVGKTTFAVHVGHLTASRFPDGQLFIDLGGPQPTAAADVLRTVLRGLGVREALPQTTGELAALLRSVLAQRRVLVVLDDAVDSEQVAPLLPGTPGCAVVVTSRSSLSALEPGVQLGLAAFTEDEALELLARVVSRDRVDAEPAQSAALVRYCDRLPLAVRIAGARLRARPDWPIGHLAVRVADERRRLDELEIGQTGVRATLAVSFAHLARGRGRFDRAAAEAYPLLALFAARDIDVVVAARLLDRSERDTERILERLTDLHLLTAGEPGWYRQFDLLRALGVEQAGVLDERYQAAALGRVLELYAEVGWRGVELANPGSPRLRWAVGPPPVDFADATAVFDWLHERRAHLVQVVTAAAANPSTAPEHVLTAALSFIEYFRSRGLWSAWADTCRAALAAAGPGGDPVRVAMVHSDLAVAHAESAQTEKGDFDAARSHAGASVAAVTSAGGGPVLALVLNNQCYVLGLAGDIVPAIAAGERSIAVSAEHGFRQLQALTTVTVGRLLGLQGDVAGEEQRYRAAVRIAEELGIVHARAYALHQLGTVHQRTHAYAAAAVAFEGSAAAWRSVGEWPGEECALAALGETQVALGRRADAVATFRSALALATRAGLAAEQCRLRECLDRAGSPE